MGKTKKTGSEKVGFEVDPHNRLVARETGGETEICRFRHVLTGRFKTDKNNVLSYHVKAPMPSGAQVPHQVKLQGNWSLTDDHNLEFTLNKWARQTLGDKLTLQGRILDAKKNSLLFSVTTKTKKDVCSTYILNLSGVWRADKRNRLTFRVKKENGKYDILTFRGGWNIDEQHRIVYEYEKAQLITKRKQLHRLIFDGYWDIKDAVRLWYVIDMRSDSVFAFKTEAGIFKGEYVKYEVGIDVSGNGELKTRTITLYGTWKIKKGIGLTFEIEYENKRVHAIVFRSDVKLTSKDQMSFTLRKERGKEIVGKLELSRKILKGDAEAFLRFLRSKDETAVIVGAGFRW